MVFDISTIEGILPWGMAGFAVLMLWTAFWKGLALWHAARRGKHLWFIGLLFINTAGILEIVYLFFVERIQPKGLFTRDGRAP